MPMRRTYRRRRPTTRRYRRKRVAFNRRRTAAKRKYRKRAGRATFRTNGFPRTKVVTLKYCDNITDLTPRSGDVFGNEHAPGMARFSANCSGRPDVPGTDFPPLTRYFRGQRPHQPLGFDQYAVIYRSCRVLKSTITVDLNWSRAAGFSQAVPTPDNESPPATVGYGGAYTRINGVPNGFYCGLVKMWRNDPLLLPQVYSEFLERFATGLKFVPYRDLQQHYGVRLTSSYVKPRKAVAQSFLRGDPSSYTGTGNVSNGTTYSQDPFTFQTGDFPGGTGTVTPGIKNRLTIPSGEMHYVVVVYYPDTSGIYRLSQSSIPTAFDGFSLRGTVRLKYTSMFSRKRILNRSWLTTTPGLNPQLGTGTGLPGPGQSDAVAGDDTQAVGQDADGDGTFEQLNEADGFDDE